MLVLLRAFNSNGTTSFHDFDVHNNFRHLAQNIYGEKHIFSFIFLQNKEKGFGNDNVHWQLSDLFIYFEMNPEHVKELT
jgi:hypothetical protein